MKRILLSSLASLVIAAGYCSAQDTAAELKDPTQAAVLSAAKIAALKQAYTNPVTKVSYMWSGNFGLAQMTTVQKIKAKKTKKIPFRITGALYEITEIRGKKTRKRISGDCNIFLYDTEGKVVLKQIKPLSKMCPS